MPDTRPRNAEGQFSPETGGGVNPSSFQAAYNPAIIMQNDQSRQAILAAVNKRKHMTQPQRGVEGTEPSGASDTMMSSFLGRIIELSRYSETLRGVDNIESYLKARKGRLASHVVAVKPKQHPSFEEFKERFGRSLAAWAQKGQAPILN